LLEGKKSLIGVWLINSINLKNNLHKNMKHIYIPELNILLDKETAFISTITSISFDTEVVVKKEGIFGFTFSKKEPVTSKIYSFVVGDHKKATSITEKKFDCFRY